MLDCLLEDLAYLLGLTCGRGTLDYSENSLAIDIPFKSIEAEGISKVFNQRDQMIIGTDHLVNRLGEFTGLFVRKETSESMVRIKINFVHATHTWKSIVAFFHGQTDFHYFEIPPDFSRAPQNLKICFLQGFSDVAGFIRKSNYDQSHRYRVYLEIPNSNWCLPIQLCKLLQSPDINIPVQMINWGHPNTRGRGMWSKEHQIKIYAEYFTKIGFTISFKNEILVELANANIEKFGMKTPVFCEPSSKRIRKPKSLSDKVDSAQIPISLRGNQYNSFWQICGDLGCDRCRS